MARCPHSEFRKGQKILILFKKGGSMVGKFEESKSGIIIVDGKRIFLKDIRNTVIFNSNY